MANVSDQLGPSLSASHRLIYGLLLFSLAHTQDTVGK